MSFVHFLSVWTAPNMHSSVFHLIICIAYTNLKSDLFTVYIRQAEDNKDGKKLSVFLCFNGFLSIQNQP